MITVYALTYNEQVFIQFLIDHYRSRFPGCRIVVYDNMSTDDTVDIALANGCEIVPFDTQGQFQDRRHMEIKNHCWKTATTDWVVVCDYDELIDIDKAALEAEESAGSTIITPEVYDMFNMHNNLDIAGIRHGVPSQIPGKKILFNKKFVHQMNYGPGAHSCEPEGRIVYSKPYKLFHYANVNEDLTISKFRDLQARLSPENLAMGWGIQYHMTPEEIRQEYAEGRQKAVIVR